MCVCVFIGVHCLLASFCRRQSFPVMTEHTSRAFWKVQFLLGWTELECTAQSDQNPGAQLIIKKGATNARPETWCQSILSHRWCPSFSGKSSHLHWLGLSLCDLPTPLRCSPMLRSEYRTRLDMHSLGRVLRIRLPERTWSHLHGSKNSRTWNWIRWAFMCICLSAEATGNYWLSITMRHMCRLFEPIPCHYVLIGDYYGGLYHPLEQRSEL